MIVATDVGRLDGIGGSGLVSQGDHVAFVGDSRSRYEVEDAPVWQVTSKSLISECDSDGLAACELR